VAVYSFRERFPATGLHSESKPPNARCWCRPDGNRRFDSLAGFQPRDFSRSGRIVIVVFTGGT
jgi:hypothetical protein